MFTLPRMTTAKELQRNYRHIFDLAKKSREPIIVMRNNKPDVAIVDAREWEKREAILDVLESREDARAGKTKILKSLKDLR